MLFTKIIIFIINMKYYTIHNYKHILNGKANPPNLTLTCTWYTSNTVVHLVLTSRDIED